MDCPTTSPSASAGQSTSNICSVSYTWRITNFKLKIDKDKFKSDDNPSLVSQRFGLPGWMWELRLHPRGDGPDNSGHISIYLAAVRSEREIAIDRSDARGDRSSSGCPMIWSRSVRYTISIPRTRGVDGGDAGNVYSGTSSNVFESQCALSWGWKKYLDRSRLDEALQPDGSLLLNVEVHGDCPTGLSIVDLEPLKTSMLDEASATECRQLLFSPLLADIEFHIYEDSAKKSQPTTLYGHRQIISLRSEYWRTMFTSGLRESEGVFRDRALAQKPGEARLTIIDIVDVPLGGFKAMMEFLYTTRVATYYPRTREEKFDVLMIADRYQLPGLHNIIGLELAKEILKPTQRINVPDILELLNVATTFGGGECTTLKEVCLSYCKARLPDLKNDLETFKTWCKEADRELLAELWTSQNNYYY